MMKNFENICEALHSEGLNLDQAHLSRNLIIQKALKNKSTQEQMSQFEKLTQYLTPYSLEFITDSAVAEATVAQLHSTLLLGLDIETRKLADHPQAGLNPKVSQIRLVQLFDGQTIYVFDCLKIGSVNWIKPLQEHPMVAHNALFEAQHFYAVGIEFSDLDCTMLEGRVFLNTNLSLKEAASTFLNLDMAKDLQVSDWSRPDLLPEQIHYAALDAVVAYQLHQCYLQGFKSNPMYWDTYQLLRALIYPLVRQQSQGIRIDSMEHQCLIDTWKKRKTECLKVLNEDGLKNPNSVPQAQAYLQSKLSVTELSQWPRTDKGNLSTASQVMQQYNNHPQLKSLAEYKMLSSRLSNFGDKLQQLRISDRLYPSYTIAGMVSGRFGCSKPNFQNQPRNGFKHIYIAPEGFQFVTGDLSQVELRVAGLISGDSVINEAYAEGKDLHRMMAAKMTGKSVDQITKEERTAAKGVNFGLLYGSGARALREYVKKSYGIDMSLEDAEKAKATFHATYPELTYWQKQIVYETNQTDLSQSCYSRLKRHYTKEDHYKSGEYKDIYTHAMNFPVQSTAWELLALTILYVDHLLPQDGSIYISHHVYDELCLCAQDEQIPKAARLLKDAFEYAYQTIFPGYPLKGIVEIGAGKNWAEAGMDESIIPLD